MIQHFYQCDTDYGRRVAEGLQNASGNLQKGPSGTAHSGDAVKEAIEVSHEAKPY